MPFFKAFKFFSHSLVSAQVKQEIQCDLDIPYGVGEGEKFDIFGAETLPKGIEVRTYIIRELKLIFLLLILDASVFIYIHGGYWQALDRNISSYCVQPLFKAGSVVAVVGYDLTPKGLLPTTVSMTTLIINSLSFLHI